MRRLFLIYALLFSIYSLIAQKQIINIFHLTMKDELLINEANTISNDSKGFLWVATLKELKKIVDYRFKLHKSEVGNLATLSGNSISKIVEDKNEKLYNGDSLGDINNYNPAEIEISPPYWRTNIAYLVYLLIILGALFVYHHYTLLRFKKKTRLELNQMKIRFFTNISHELRTPLTLISGPLNKMVDDLRNNSVNTEILMKQFLLMQRNTQRLVMLINQLFDMQKSETGKLQLQASHGDLIFFVHTIYDVFTPVAEQNNIIYSFEKQTDTFVTDFDADKMERIFYNLISNAFKFTKDKVILKIELENAKVIVTVHDNGIGIAKGNLTKVFENFFQVDDLKTLRN